MRSHLERVPDPSTQFEELSFLAPFRVLTDSLSPGGLRYAPTTGYSLLPSGLRIATPHSST